jgi:phosphoglycolate phosphatase-like HAD superfamily hydrolase
VFESQLRRFLAGGGGVPIPGAENAIRAIARGRHQGGADQRLRPRADRRHRRALRLGKLYDAIVYPDEVPAGRPAHYLILQAMQKTLVHPVARVAAIGDTALDLQAGANAGTGWVIGVLSGAHDAATLGRTPAHHLLTSIAEVPLLFGID